ncbi:MAG: hypothetical protein ACXU89_18665, partial [Xanthobacteraceae bacterium]
MLALAHPAFRPVDRAMPRHNFAPMCTHPRRTWNAGGVMFSKTGYGRAMLLILAAGVSLTFMPWASAQTSPWPEDQQAPAADAAATPEADDSDIKGLELDWSQLNVDASTLATRPVSKARSSQSGTGSDMSWSSKKDANGSAAVSVKQPVSPFWDAKVGADMMVARQPSTMSELLAEKAE